MPEPDLEKSTVSLKLLRSLSELPAFSYSGTATSMIQRPSLSSGAEAFTGENLGSTPLQ